MITSAGFERVSSGLPFQHFQLNHLALCWRSPYFVDIYIYIYIFIFVGWGGRGGGRGERGWRAVGGGRMGEGGEGSC